MVNQIVLSVRTVQSEVHLSAADAADLLMADQKLFLVSVILAQQVLIVGIDQIKNLVLV